MSLNYLTQGIFFPFFPWNKKFNLQRVKSSNTANIRELMHMCVLLTYIYECIPKGYACVCFEKPTHLDEMHRNLLQKVVLPMNILLTFSMYVRDW